MLPNGGGSQTGPLQIQARTCIVRQNKKGREVRTFELSLIMKGNLNLCQAARFGWFSGSDLNDHKATF